MPDFLCLAFKCSIYSCISTTTILESDRKLKLFTSIFFPRYYRCLTMQVLEYHCRMFGSSLFDFLKGCKMYSVLLGDEPYFKRGMSKMGDQI